MQSWGGLMTDAYQLFGVSSFFSSVVLHVESAASFLSFTNDCFVMLTCGGSRLEKHDLHRCQLLSGYWVFLWLHVWSSYSHVMKSAVRKLYRHRSRSHLTCFDSQVTVRCGHVWQKWHCTLLGGTFTICACVFFFCFFFPGDIRRVGLTYFDSLTHLQLIAADLARGRILALVREVPGSNPGRAPTLCYVPV